MENISTENTQETIPQTEAALVEEVAADISSQASEAAKEDMSEVAMASKTFQQLNEIFSNVLERYEGSKAQIVRSWRNAALSPLNQSPLHFSYPEEKEIFDLYTELNSVKLVLMVHGLAEAGVLTLHKPLMSAVPKTASEVELNKLMGDVERQADEVAALQAAAPQSEQTNEAPASN